jgi:hypothetical protein
MWRMDGWDAERRDVKLDFLDLVNELNPGDGDSGMIEALKAQHGSHALFDSAVVCSIMLFKYLFVLTVRSVGNTPSSCSIALAVSVLVIYLYGSPALRKRSTASSLSTGFL